MCGDTKVPRACVRNLSPTQKTSVRNEDTQAASFEEAADYRQGFRYAPSPAYGLSPPFGGFW